MSNVTPIFLMSLPRAGSTLAQRVLSSHAYIATAAEPWILLPHFSHLAPDGTCADYDFNTACIAINEFLEKLNGGREAYLQILRRFALEIYSTLSAESKPFVLDKTPRYSLIANELHDVFSDAKFLYLWRNPLSVVASCIETWGRPGQWNVHRIHVDLFVGLPRLIDSYNQHSGSACAFRYEDLVASSDEWKRVFVYLGLEWNESVLSDISKSTVVGTMGDKTGMEQYRSLSDKSIHKWKDTINNPLRKMWCKRYLRWLGAKRLAVMGYDLDFLINEIDLVPNKYTSVPMDVLAITYGMVYGLFELPMLRVQFHKFFKREKLVAHR